MGWAGIGYHYFIIKDGTIYQTQPDYVISNHASSYNDNSLGVNMENNNNLYSNQKFYPFDDCDCTCCDSDDCC